MNFLKLFQKKINVPAEAKNGYGFKEVVPREHDYMLGGKRQSLKVILSPERDYTDVKPVFEKQKRNFDSYSCVIFSGLNNLEIIFKKKFGFEINYSDRFLAALTPVKPNYGTNYTAFWDALRKYGVVLEEDYPWGGEDGYEYVKTPPQEIIDKGELFKNEFEVQHEWIDYGGCDPNKLYEALLYGPLQVSVNAGATYKGEYNTSTNHSVTIIGVKKGKAFTILDHYREQYTVPWTFYFGSAKQASLMKKKHVQLVQVWGDPKVYAIYGTVACHIADEETWVYGSKIGIWKQRDITLITKNAFHNRFTVGRPLTFNV